VYKPGQNGIHHEEQEETRRVLKVRMKNSARDEILARLRTASRRPVQPRPALPPLRELSLDLEGLISRFSENLTLQGGVVHRTTDAQGLLTTLGDILRAEAVRRAVVSSDDVVRPLELPQWSKDKGLALVPAATLKDRATYREAVFQADAGITGGDFAVAESGTIALFHGKDQARLLSLAPPIHIVLIPVDRVVPTYEKVIEAAYARETPPSQISFITGPSASADIQATPFKGMHGPQKLVVILMESFTPDQER
jgi:L-lactate dehydrogenase complex protein LldG